MLLSWSADFRHWAGRWYVPLKRLFTYGLQGAISQKIAAFITTNHLNPVYSHSYSNRVTETQADYHVIGKRGSYIPSSCPLRFWIFRFKLEKRIFAEYTNMAEVLLCTDILGSQNVYQCLGQWVKCIQVMSHDTDLAKHLWKYLSQ
jgi:hypothetical protein